MPEYQRVDPYALRGLPDKPVVERFVRAIDIRRIDPATARLQDVHDAADNPPIIDPRLLPRVSVGNNGASREN